jgi:ABC-2 type transport system permease protein
MSYVLLVARREFTERLRDRVFILSNVFLLLVVVVAPILFAVFAGGEEAIRLGAVGSEASAAAVAADERSQLFDLDIEVSEVPDRAAADQALAAGELDAVLLDPRTVLVASEPPDGLEPLLASTASGLALEEVLTEAGVDADEIAALGEQSIEVTALSEPEEFDFGPGFYVGFLGVSLLYGLLFLYGQWVAQGIVEEKSSRVIEVLLSAVSPTRLLAGKVLGLGSLGLLQVLLISVVGVGAVLVTGMVELPANVWGTVALVVAWYLLGYATYATVFAIAGALCSRMEDLQSTVMPAYVLLIGSFYIALTTASNPGSSLSRIAGLAPFTAPVLQPLRTSVGASQPWEIAVAIVLSVVTIAVLIPLAARFYSGGALFVTRKVGLREAWRGAAR